MRETLPVALRLMFGDEGGYSNRKSDRGGPTKYGITHRTLAAHLGVPSVSAERVKALTLAEAEVIYRKSYWTQAGGDVLPKGLDYAAFDFGVNSGPNRAVKYLQRVVGVKQDGWIGEKTMAAVNAYPGGVGALIIAYCAARMSFLKAIKGPTGFAANGRGWTIRVTGKDPKGQWPDRPGVVGHALEMAGGNNLHAGPVIEDEVPEGGNSKAEPTDGNPWLKPEVILPGGGTLLGAAGTLFSGMGPIQWAMAGVILIAAVVGAVYVVRHLKANPA